MPFTTNKKEELILRERLQWSSNKKTGKALGIPRRTIDRTINRIIARAEEAGVPVEVDTPRILIMDIETAPMLSYLWSFWQKGVNHQCQERPTYILSWAAKWLDEPEVMADALCYNPNYTEGDEDDERMLAGIWNLLDEADFVVAHNGDRFDIKRLNTGFLLAGFAPPAPYKAIDTLKMVKRAFAFDSNRLDYLLGQLFGSGKIETGGFETWRQVMAGSVEAWDRLIEYNKHDVLELERLYLEIRAWDKSHPSAATHGGRVSDSPVCTTCGSEDVRLTDKTTSTNASRFRVWRCDSCGTPMRERTSLLTPQQKQNLLMRVK